MNKPKPDKPNLVAFGKEKKPNGDKDKKYNPKKKSSDGLSPKMQKLAIESDDDFWLLFKKRNYRSNGSCKNFVLDINAVYGNTSDDWFVGQRFTKIYDGILIKDLYSMYKKNKEKLLERKDVDIEAFEVFFNSYQYGDTVDHVDGYRGSLLFIIGYSNNDNNISDLRLLGTWGDYGYGIPIEFGDAPKTYFHSDEITEDDAVRAFDALRLLHTEEEKENNKDYFYMELMEQIDKFPKDDVIYYDPAVVEWDSLSKDMDEYNEAKPIEWAKTYDTAVRERKYKIRNYCCSVCHVFDDNIVGIITDFLL